MAVVNGTVNIQMSIDKYEAFRALAENLGFYMFKNNDEKDYKIENGVLYHMVDRSYHGSPKIQKEFYTDDYKKVQMFECLITLKNYLGEINVQNINY